MVSAATIEEFLTNQTVTVDYRYLIISLVVASVLSYILKRMYIRYGTSLSNRQRFSSIFILLTPTTTLIITVVKSSLALSLGLVGALSIVRFRTAIKEPEELGFLFLAIGVGLGLGAGQMLTTITAFAFMMILVVARHAASKKKEEQNLHLSITGKGLELDKVTDILDKHCEAIHLKRFDYTSDGTLEASFLVDFNNFKDIGKVRDELKKISKNSSITYLDRSGFN